LYVNGRMIMRLAMKRVTVLEKFNVLRREAFWTSLRYIFLTIAPQLNGKNASFDSRCREALWRILVCTAARATARSGAPLHLCQWVHLVWPSSIFGPSRVSCLLYLHHRFLLSFFALFVYFIQSDIITYSQRAHSLFSQREHATTLLRLLVSYSEVPLGTRGYQWFLLQNMCYCIDRICVLQFHKNDCTVGPALRNVSHGV
jgi:hypothetical protein